MIRVVTKTDAGESEKEEAEEVSHNIKSLFLRLSILRSCCNLNCLSAERGSAHHNKWKDIWSEYNN